MARDASKFLHVIRGGRDRPASIVNLPAPDTKRWVPRRKAEVVAAVHSGALSLDEACRRYALTVEEFLSWQNAMERYGLDGLRAGRMQQHRQPH